MLRSRRPTARAPLTFAMMCAIGALLAGCGSAPPVAAEPVSLSFRPTHDGAPLATPFAIEVLTERDARVLEAMDAEYLGEINVSHGKLSSAIASMVAAQWGATHFRVTTSERTKRVDILLYRVEKKRWEHLPVLLQPPALTTSL